MTARYVGALDQGTTSTRFLIFDESGREVARRQFEHRQHLPQPGWVEHDPDEIVQCATASITGALSSVGLSGVDLAAIGVTNQRETIVAWSPTTGRPWYNAIVWQDTRTAQAVSSLAPRRVWVGERTGLPLATYFSASKLQWLLDHVAGLRTAAEIGDALFGTIDTWLIWNLTGGRDGGTHVTDVTNASRTMLMNLRTLDWDEDLLELFGVPRRALPAILRSASSRTVFGSTRREGPFGSEVPVAAALGDQHAALVGQACFAAGEAKNTYGTGNFLLLHTSRQIVSSTHGLLTTIAHDLPTDRVDSSSSAPGDAPNDRGAPCYALEGSIAVTGAAVQWLRDRLGIIRSAGEIESLAKTVPDSGGVYFVPAFSGLFAPYWRPDARGLIAGLSHFHTSAHLARATLEAICFQTRAVFEAMVDDSGVPLELLKVDGGATVNDTLMQLQADILGVTVVRPAIVETTALGAAYAAGLAVGVWKDLDELRRLWTPDRRWDPEWSEDRREQAYDGWKKTVERSLNWTSN